MSAKFFFWGEDWVLSYNSMMSSDFPDFALFPKILSPTLFGNSYIQCLLLIIMPRFTCGEKKNWYQKYQKFLKYYVHHCSYE